MPFNSLPADLETLLTITTVDDGKGVLPLYSARRLTQTLEPIDGASFQMRTVNGELVDLSVPRFRKFRSVISGNDVRPPSRDDIWPGRKVTVGCAYLLSYPTVGGTPSRAVLTGSDFVEGDRTFYQPLITFMLGRASGNFDEWESGYRWALPMEEV